MAVAHADAVRADFDGLEFGNWSLACWSSAEFRVMRYICKAALLALKIREPRARNPREYAVVEDFGNIITNYSKRLLFFCKPGVRSVGYEVVIEKQRDVLTRLGLPMFELFRQRGPDGDLVIAPIVAHLEELDAYLDFLNTA